MKIRVSSKRDEDGATVSLRDIKVVQLEAPSEENYNQLMCSYFHSPKTIVNV
jgi:hypothetical protein